MKTKNLITLSFLFLLLAACTKKSAIDFNSDFLLFKEHISSFTSGMVSAQTDIRVVLTTDQKNWNVGDVLDTNLFDISPSIDGKVVALSSNTIAFLPEKKLKPNTEYQVTFHLSKIKTVKSDLADFNFTVKTIKQDFVVNAADIQSYSTDYQYLNCNIKTADNMTLAEVQTLVKAKQGNNELKIEFDKVEGKSTEFHFIIDSIQRFNEESTLEIDYDGNDLDIDQKGNISYNITAKSDFKIVNVTAPDGENQTLLINFSEPLERGQDFKGLVAIQNTNNLTFSTQGNLLKVFFNNEKETKTQQKPVAQVAPQTLTDSATTAVTETVIDTTTIEALPEPAVTETIDTPETAAQQVLLGALRLEVFEGIESEFGKKLKENYNSVINFDQIKPNVRFVKNGTILPSSNNLKINFEAANLSAVDVKIYKIYKNNILQFLQDNALNGTQNLKKVAQPVAKSKIDFLENKLLNLGKWNTYALDLAKIIKPEPGAIYRVELSFSKKYSLYKCQNTEEEEETETETIDENDVNYSDNYYDDYYYQDYDWRENENPCSNSYFYNARVGTNILATDLGVIAKRGENKSYFIAVNNILTTNPVANAKVELYNFQQQKLGQTTTNNNGIAEFKLNTFAFFAIVSQGEQATYVKLDDGASLSLSNFDVAGEKLQKGLKGFIYGERGVWRPGDNLYLSFIFNDNENKLPANHPIKFRLTDPNGKTVYETFQKTNALNHYSFTVPTNPDAPTGSWEAVVSVGGANFYKNIKIETIKPNRLKIKNSLGNRMLTSATANTNSLSVMWLHGAIAKNLKVSMLAKFSQQKTVFKGYESYDFDDEIRKFNTEEINVFSGQLNANGTTTFNIQPKLKGQAPGMLRANFATKVFEQGGDFSMDVASTTFSPYKTYLGIKTPELTKYNMLETNTNNRFDIVSVNEFGNPVAAKNLEIKVYKVAWRWWWDSGQDEVSSYNASEATTFYKSFIVNTNAAGKGSFIMKLENEEWGRYMIRVVDPANAHATALTVNIDWPSWSGKTRNGEGSTANMLVFSTDKKSYHVGETAQVSFPSSTGGRALIAIENGSKVVKSVWAQTQQGETKISIPITADMAPNVYFNISLLQPHASTKNDSPIRMYGIVPVGVTDKNTILEPKISMPDVLKPEQKFAVNVSEKSGREMTYTIAVVDEGLLDLTRFKTPNAWDSFFVREALGVKTWDVYDDVIGAYGGTINQIFSIGGDQDLGGGKAKKANRFKPVVMYFGPFKLQKGQSKTTEIVLPKYIGSVKTMVVAANAAENAYGSVEKITVVKSPLMTLATLPRKISPSERVTIPVTVFAMEKNIKNVNVQIKTNNGVKVLGASSQNISFAEPDEKMVYFNLAVGQATGIAKVQITSKAGKNKSVYEVELDMTNPNPKTTTFTDVVLLPNRSQTIVWKTFGVFASNAAKLEISSMPTLNLNGRLQYLIAYPHGCVEQTTSSVFPQLYLNDLADVDVTQKNLIQKNITVGIAKLNKFQLSNGGFAYWSGDQIADDWGTSYAGHFLVEAEKKGYALPNGMKQKWISYQQKEAKKWRFAPQYGNDFAQAYRLYTLALVGLPDLSSMNRLRETSGTANETKLRLATAYFLSGQKAAGMSLLSKSKIDDDLNGYDYFYFGSSDRNRAMALETLLMLDQKQRAFEMATKLAKNLASEAWMSTQTTAFGLYAMSKFALQNGPKGIDVSFSNQKISTNKTVLERALNLQNGSNSITIKNNKNNTLYVRLYNSGILPIGQEQLVQNNFSTSIVFKNRKGAVLKINKIAQSTELIAEVVVKNLKNEKVENVALTQILPSGFEIVNTRFTDFGNVDNNIANFIDIRDDRTNFYFGLKANETKTFRILLNASFLGNYYLPGLQCEAMYDHTFLSRTKGFWVEVVP